MRGWEKAFEDIVGPQRFAEVKRIAAEDDLREKLRLSAARAKPSAYSIGCRVLMHNRTNTVVWRGTIIQPLPKTGADQRRIEWDDGMFSTIDVTQLELIEED